MHCVCQAKLQKIDEKLRTDRSKQLEQQTEVLAKRKASDLTRKDALVDERKELDGRLKRLVVIAHEASLCHFVKTSASSGHTHTIMAIARCVCA